MLRSIRIENFRGIRQAEVKRLKRLNLVTGQNGGGKFRDGTGSPDARFVRSGRGNTWCLMSSIYERFASDCVRLAAKSKDKSTRAELYRLARQWQSMGAEAQGEVGRSAHTPKPAFQAPERR
jgi:hypothetical protein